MRIDSPEVKEGSRITNLVCPIGTAFPTKVTEGELFRLRGNASIPAGLYIYDNAEWGLLAKAKPFAEVGSNIIIDVNTASIVPINLNLAYYVAPSTFELIGGNIKIKVAGTYEIYYSLSIDSSSSNSRKTIQTFIRKQASGLTLTKSLGYGSISDNSTNDVVTISVTFKEQFAANDVIQLCGVRRSTNNTGSAYTISDNAVLGISRID